MDIRLHLLETFAARGSDGAAYKVCAYERLVPDLSAGAAADAWASSGVVEYRLQDGRLVDAGRDGALRVVGTSLTLAPDQPRPANAGLEAASA